MNNEQGPSAERLQKPKSIRIETETGMIHGSLLSSEESQRIISVTGFDREDEYLIRFEVGGLKVNEPFDFEYSLDGGQSWQHRNSDSPLKGLKTWERASKVVTFDDLVDGAVVPEPKENIDDDSYRQYSEYDYANEALKYAQEHPEGAKRLTGFNRNTGWKVHFTPNVDFVPEISSYLKANGYDHKYLYGGEPSDGKAYTVYFGSRQMMEKWVTELEGEFEDKLLPALAENEEAVTPHFSARFTSVDKDETGTSLFHQYGVHGMSACHSTMNKRARERLGYPTGAEADDVALEAYNELSKRYGSYFHG